MYNRYIPQADGSYRRDRVASPQQPQRSQQPSRPSPQRPPEPPPCPPEPEPPKCTGCNCKHCRSSPKRREPPRQEGSVSSFLRNILPKDFDTGDLIIVLLLLLMAGDHPDDQNSALLTLALYFIM